MEPEGDCEWGQEGASGVFPIHFISRNSMEDAGSEMGGLGGGRDSASSQFESCYIDSALPSDSDHAYDHHSSEEELEDINNSYQEVDDLQSESLLGDDEVRGPGSENKRKWSQVASNRLSVESTSSSDEEVQGLLRPLSTPVEFCTSPPVDAHKPSRSQSPPPKLFLFSSPGCENAVGGRVVSSGPVAIHTGGVFRGLRRCDQNVGDHHRHSHGSPLQSHQLGTYNLSNGTESSLGAERSESRSHPSDQSVTTATGGGNGRASRNGRDSNSRKRHRHHNPRHIQRPWLDFEKMQQVRLKISVNSHCPYLLGLRGLPREVRQALREVGLHGWLY